MRVDFESLGPAIARRRWYRRHAKLRWLVGLGAGALSLGVGGYGYWQSGSLPATWIPQALLSLVSLGGLSAAVVWQHRVWHRPVRRLKRLLPRIIEGHEPIDALSSINGVAGELTPVLRELLHTMRQRKTAVNEIHAEIGERVARRTDALERAIGSLRQQATRDVLTGLHNRRAMDDMFPRLLERCHAQGEDLCVVMADIDYFKHLNDSLGHAAGDTFLRSVGQLIRSSLRQDDLAFRIGGDEFVLLLPNCPPDQAQSIVRRIGMLVDSLAKPLKLAMTPRLAMGFIALSQMREPTVQAMIREADARLYATKHGRVSAA